MIELHGRVVVENTGSPAAGVVVEAFDMSGADSARLLGTRDWAILLAQPSLGSDITDSTGGFTIAFDTAPGATVPVGLAVLAPDGPGDTGDGVLHLVPRVRQVQQGRQAYLIALPADDLRVVPASPLPAAVAPDAPTAAVATAAVRADAAADVVAGVAEIRGHLADELRPRREAIESAIRTTLFERAFGSRRLADGTYPPEVLGLDEDVRSHTRALLDDVLRRRANQVSTRAIVDVTDADVGRLLDTNGAPLPSVSQADIEQLLFGPSHTDGAPARYRRDSVEVARRTRVPPDARCQPDGGSGGGGGGGGGAPAPSPQEATLSDVKAALLRLLEDSEAAVAGAQLESRASATELGQALRALTLAEGPADRTSTFTFERLYLASDLLVAHFPDFGVVNDFADAVIAVEGLGGKVAQPRTGKDLLDAIEVEARTLVAADPVQPAQGPPRVMAMLGLPNPIDAAVDAIGGAAGAVGELFGGSARGTTSSGRGRVRDHRGDPTGSREPYHVDRLADLRLFLERLRRIRREDYGFTAFAVDRNGRTCTYGLLLEFEQQWRPKGYQAGELVKTIPLAPKSSVRYTAKRKSSRTYTDKRAEASESTYSSEAQDTQRDIAKIVRNAKLATSFSLTSETGAGVPGAASSSTTSVWNVSAERSTESTKESFREEIRKQAETLKRTSSVEVTLTTGEETEFEETSEIRNDNDALVITYLFYELRNAFNVSERLRRVTPAILVAQDVPDPSEIDEVWVTRYDWILRRVLLDATFHAAIDYVVSGKLVADLGKAKELSAALDRQAAVVAGLERQLFVLRSDDLLPDPRNIFEQFKVRVYDEKYPDWREDEARVREVFGDDVAQQVARRKEAIQATEGELQREATQLQTAAETYTTAFVQYALEAVQVERLLIHLKENILYYLQAILDHEVRDQQFLRLRDTRVPKVQGRVRYQLAQTDRPRRAPTFNAPLEVRATATLSVDGEEKLGDVANLAKPLGYVGNAVVFELTRWDPLVTFLMAPFSSSVTGVADPDAGGAMSLDEVERLVCGLKENLSPAEYQAPKPRIDEASLARVLDPQPDSQEIVIPTGSLFMEALPGSHAVLEDFKLAHRALDVSQVALTSVTNRIEQLRLAARIISDQFDDPDTEKVVIRERDAANPVIDT
ncbi:MAG: hypothetical protein WBL05_07310 [Brooklawnia sp.]|uniref:hypothetical protein n=1 Tax=Brooklawnia sp. TaxID=2699740 RepID=UPI003C70BE4B